MPIDYSLPSWLQLAQTVSLHSSYKIAMGAVLVQRGTPIAVGFNQERSHPRWVCGLASTVHAEISALMTVAKRDLTGSTVYVYRAHKNGTPALARPCANCQLILQQYGIKRMLYTINDSPYYNSERL
jgi:deoxycytidylate deaminase